MKRRTFVKALPLTALPLLPGCSEGGTDAGQASRTSDGATPPNESAEASVSSGSQRQEVPSYAGKLQHSDGSVTNTTGATQPGFKDRTNDKVDPKAPYQMPLTQEEQDIMDGKKGPELAKVMKIVVAHGNAFGAERLVDLGGAPHCSL